jgi:hypothetical protein
VAAHMVQCRPTRVLTCNTERTDCNTAAGRIHLLLHSKAAGITSDDYTMSSGGSPCLLTASALSIDEV